MKCFVRRTEPADLDRCEGKAFFEVVARENVGDNALIAAKEETTKRGKGAEESGTLGQLWAG